MAAYTPASSRHEPAPTPLLERITNVLSRIVADLVGYGDLYRDYLRKRLFDPLGMHSPVAASTRSVSSSRRASCTRAPWTSRSSACSTCAAASGTAPADLASVGGDGPDAAQSRRGGRHIVSWQWWVSDDQFGTYSANGYEASASSWRPRSTRWSCAWATRPPSATRRSTPGAHECSRCWRLARRLVVKPRSGALKSASNAQPSWAASVAAVPPRSTTARSSTTSRQSRRRPSGLAQARASRDSVLGDDHTIALEQRAAMRRGTVVLHFLSNAKGPQRPSEGRRDARRDERRAVGAHRETPIASRRRDPLEHQRSHVQHRLGRADRLLGVDEPRRSPS